MSMGTRPAIGCIVALVTALGAAACGSSAPLGAGQANVTSTNTDPNQQAVSSTPGVPQGTAQVDGVLSGLGITARQAIYTPIDKSFGGGITEVVIGEQQDLCAANNYQADYRGSVMRIDVFSDGADMGVGDYTIYTPFIYIPDRAKLWASLTLGGTASDGNGVLAEANTGIVHLTAMPNAEANTLQLNFSADDPNGGAGVNGKVTAVLCPDPVN